MDPLPDETLPEFTLSWSGTDAVGEIEAYTVFVSVDGQGFKSFMDETTDTSTVFVGEENKKYEFLCVAKDTAGNVENQAVSAEVSTKVVSPNRPPVADAGGDQIVECTNSSATPVQLDGTKSYDPDGDSLTYLWDWPSGIVTGETPQINVPLGISTINLTVNDGELESLPDSMQVMVKDTRPPEIFVTCSPVVLWPPDHKMVEITPTINVSDICDASVRVELFQINMNEGDGMNTYDLAYDKSLGDGNTSGDIQVRADGRIYLRAERSGNHVEGREYFLVYQAIDASGNSATASCNISVPHDMK